MYDLIHSVNLDANETIFFARELERILQETYDVKYPELVATKFLPVSMEAGPGAETITYRQFDMLGQAKIIANYANDLPRVDVKGKEFSTPVRSVGECYGYNLQEIRAAAMANRPLAQMRANSARRANDQLVDSIGWFGDSASGLGGFLSNASITTGTVPADGTGAATTFVSKVDVPNGNPKIIRDVNNMINGIRVLTLDVEQATDVLFSVATYTLLASTPRSTQGDMTILEFLQKAHPEIVFSIITKLGGIGVGGSDVMVAYRRAIDAVQFHIPSPFEQLPPQEEGLEFIVNCHSRCGGVIIPYPLSVSKFDGV